MKVGIFSGSFNPIHIGHLALANYICEYEGVDEVWFVVSPRNPLKNEADLLDDQLRLKLVRLAIEGYPHFVASDVEFHLPRPSYTINTLEYLKSTFPDKDFYLIIGADNWTVFNQWKDSAKILLHTKLLIYPRPGYPLSSTSLPSQVKLLSSSPTFDISSTFIRQALKVGKDIRYFLNPKVYEFLLHHLS